SAETAAAASDRSSLEETPSSIRRSASNLACQSQDHQARSRAALSTRRLTWPSSLGGCNSHEPLALRAASTSFSLQSHHPAPARLRSDRSNLSASVRAIQTRSRPWGAPQSLAETQSHSASSPFSATS